MSNQHEFRASPNSGGDPRDHKCVVCLRSYSSHAYQVSEEDLDTFLKQMEANHTCCSDWHYTIVRKLIGHYRLRN